MAQLLPGVQGFDVQDDSHWTADVKVPLGMGGLALKFKFEKTEQRPIEYARLGAKGQGVGAIVNMDTQFHLEPQGERTSMRWEALVRVDSDRHETALYDLDGTLVSLGLGNGWAYVTVAAAERSAAGEAIDRLRELLPPPDPSAKHEVNVTFWTYTPHGPQPSWRSI